jgi:hypothetical protein
MVDVSIQTEDAADTTLTEIEAPVFDGEIPNKKRKKCN